jgi:hypothetical protein
MIGEYLITNFNVTLMVHSAGPYSFTKMTEDEASFYKDTIGFVPSWGKIATDAFAVVMHPKAKDSLFSVA